MVYFLFVCFTLLAIALISGDTVTLSMGDTNVFSWAVPESVTGGIIVISLTMAGTISYIIYQLRSVYIFMRRKRLKKALRQRIDQNKYGLIG